MDEWNEKEERKTAGQMEERKDRRMEGRRDRRMDRWTEGWMDRWLRGGMKRGPESHWSPSPIALTRYRKQGVQQRTSFPKGHTAGLSGAPGSQCSLPHCKDILRTTPSPNCLRLPAAPSQRAKGSTAKESYLLSVPFIPALFTLGLQLTEFLSQIN